MNRTCPPFGYVPASGIVGLHWQFCVSVFSYLRSHCVLLALKRVNWRRRGRTRHLCCRMCPCLLCRPSASCSDDLLGGCVHLSCLHGELSDTGLNLAAENLFLGYLRRCTGQGSSVAFICPSWLFKECFFSFGWGNWNSAWKRSCLCSLKVTESEVKAAFPEHVGFKNTTLFWCISPPPSNAGEVT